MSLSISRCNEYSFGLIYPTSYLRIHDTTINTNKIIIFYRIMKLLESIKSLYSFLSWSQCFDFACLWKNKHHIVSSIFLKVNRDFFFALPKPSFCQDFMYWLFHQESISNGLKVLRRKLRSQRKFHYQRKHIPVTTYKGLLIMYYTI